MAATVDVGAGVLAGASRQGESQRRRALAVVPSLPVDAHGAVAARVARGGAPALVHVHAEGALGLESLPALAVPPVQAPGVVGAVKV